MKPILTTENLAIGYKSNQNVLADGISLEFFQGKLIALCGSNGIGKSTLLRTLSGFHEKLGGTILLAGQQPETFTPKDRAKKISLVLTEKPSAALKVRELVALGRQPYTNWIGRLQNEDELAIEKAMQLTGIVLSNQFCEQISDGQLQLTMIARALAQDTPLILLDEPTTHLDLPNKFALLDLLRKLAKTENKCVVFSTHDIEPALDFCDEMLLFGDRCVLQKSVSDVVAEGLLNKLFEDRNVHFDAQHSKFILKRNNSDSYL